MKHKFRIPFRLTPDGKICWDDVKGGGPTCTKVIEDMARNVELEHLGPSTPSMNEPIEVTNDQTVDT